MKIAIARNNYTQADVAGNKALIESSISAAKSAGAEVLVLARHALTGTPVYNLKISDTLPAVEGLRVIVEPVEEEDVIFIPAADRFEHGALEARVRHYAGVARGAGKPLVYVNHLGGQGDVVFDGLSFVLDTRGRLVNMSKSFEEGFVVVDTDTPGDEITVDHSHVADAHDAIILGLRDYFRKNGFTRACLGMSGGIDSAVVLALIAQVLPAENIMVLMLPSQFSSGHSVSDSQEMVARLGVCSELVSITPAFEAVVRSAGSIFADTPFGTAEENLQARLRGVMLMALSNKRGHILLNTSNKSEAAVGYGTLYGDMAGSLGPIADLYKTEVYDLARYLNREQEVIPPNIIDKAPSAELRPGQMDSDSLPPYDVLDFILMQLIEGGLSPDEVRGVDIATVQRVWALLMGAEFKRRQAAPAIKVSLRPFGDGFRLPLVSTRVRV